MKYHHLLHPWLVENDQLAIHRINLYHLLPSESLYNLHLLHCYLHHHFQLLNRQATSPALQRISACVQPMKSLDSPRNLSCSSSSPRFCTCGNNMCFHRSMLLQNKTYDTFSDLHIKNEKTYDLGTWRIEYRHDKRSLIRKGSKIEGLSNLCSSVVFEDRACGKVYELISKYTPNEQFFCILQKKKNKGKTGSSLENSNLLTYLCFTLLLFSTTIFGSTTISFPGYSVATVITTATIIATTATWKQCTHVTSWQLTLIYFTVYQ